jgi:hypothetical protein
MLLDVESDETFDGREGVEAERIAQAENVSAAQRGLVLEPGRTIGQDRLRALQRLDLRFLVEREHYRVVRRIHVEPDNVSHLGDELRVFLDLEGASDMRFEGKRPPHPADRRVAHADVRRHAARTPVSFPFWFLLENLYQHCFDRFVGDRPRRPNFRLVIEVSNRSSTKRFLHFPRFESSFGIGAPRCVRHSGSARDDEPRSKRKASIDARPSRQPRKFDALFR